MHLRVRGRVQGVGFRWWAMRTARSLRLAGTVRNCADGSVDVEAAGDSDAIARLREALGTGPAGARVSAVDELPPGDAALPDEFAIVG